MILHVVTFFYNSRQTKKEIKSRKRQENDQQGVTLPTSVHAADILNDFANYPYHHYVGERIAAG